MRNKVLSIIIPVYNVENYIRPCMLSILNQGLEENDYEIILINDGTLDNSFSKIDNLIKSHNNIKIIEQSNKGLSAARNIGLARAVGDYILFIDSDDILIENSLKRLLDIVIESKADMVVADYIVQTEESSIHNPHINYPDTIKRIVKSGPELLLDNLKIRDYYVWRTVYKRLFLKNNKIFFIEGITFEDSPFTFECYLKARKCVRIEYYFYIYRRRHSTLSSTINKKSVFDLNIVIERLWNLSHQEGINPQVRERLFEHIFAIFSLNLWYISKHNNILMKRKEIVNDLKIRVPNLVFYHGLKQHLVSFFFKTMPCAYLKIRSFI